MQELPKLYIVVAPSWSWMQSPLHVYALQDPGSHRCWACIWPTLVFEILVWRAYLLGQDWGCPAGIHSFSWISATGAGQGSQDWASCSMELLSECRHF